MFSRSIITESSSIIKFYKKSRFSLYFAKLQLHIIAIIISAMIKKGFVGKVTNVAELMPFRHRTNIGKVLTKSPWNEDYVERALRKLVVKKIWDISKATGKPIYVARDDTISERTVPSSKALGERKKNRLLKSVPVQNSKSKRRNKGDFLYNSIIGTLVKKIYMLQN